MKKEIVEILEYLKVTTKENTSKEQFNIDMDKYKLEDILEAFKIKRNNNDSAT